MWALKRGRDTLEPALPRSRAGRRFGVPPRRLRARAGAPGAEEFVEGGFHAAGELASGMRSAGLRVEGIGTVLDFGCGSGRVLPHMAASVPAARCYGCDVDPEAIGWAQRHQPKLHWTVSRPVPPLPFEDAAFEAIYSISVFSHLDEELQDEWLSELRRVLVPGGAALLSVHGAHAFEQFRSGRVRTRWCRADAFARPGPLGERDFVFEAYVRTPWNRSELPGVSARYGLAFHGPEYVRDHWSRTFEVLEVRPRAIAGWQDLVVCRRG